jgi:hypothetical protein
MGNSTGNSGLAGTGHTVQPKEVLSVGIVGPPFDSMEEIDSSSIEACRLALVEFGLSSSINDMGQLIQHPVLICIKLAFNPVSE